MTNIDGPVIMSPSTDPAVIKYELPVVEGYILFRKMSGWAKLLEVKRSADIIEITNYADSYCRMNRGTEYLIYSGPTGKWYSYYKPTGEE